GAAWGVCGDGGFASPASPTATAGSATCPVRDAPTRSDGDGGGRWAGGGRFRARPATAVGSAGVAGEGMAYEGEGASAARGSGSRTWYAWEGVNVPNAITVVRLALVPIYAWLHLHERNVAAMAAFAGAALPVRIYR